MKATTHPKRTLAALAVAAVAASAIAAPTADAAPRKFKNCDAVHKVYRHGIAKSATAARRSHVAAKVSAPLYLANAKMDRDRDGVACEAK